MTLVLGVVPPRAARAEALSRDDERTASAWADRLKRLEKAGQLEMALEWIKKCPPALRKSPELHVFRCELLTKLGREDEALRCVEQAGARDDHGKDAKLFVRRCELLARLQRKDEALRCVEQAGALEGVEQDAKLRTRLAECKEEAMRRPDAQPVTAGQAPSAPTTPALASPPAGPADERAARRVPPVPPASSAPHPALASSTPAHQEGARPHRVPLARRWWFWTAIGAGAAGLATGLVLGLVPRPYDEFHGGSR